MERTDVLIAGAGVIGSAIACALVERGVRDVAVVDVDLAGRFASSELNAGGARATWWQPVNVAACRDSLAFFAANADALSFRRCGYLWLYADAALFARAREARELQQRLGVRVDLLEPAEVARRFPVVDRELGELVGATFSPNDGLLNPNALRKLYQERAIAGGARFLNRCFVEGIELAARATGGREVSAVHLVEIAKSDTSDEGRTVERILTEHAVPGEAVVDQLAVRPRWFVNALGAWSPLVSARLGAPSRAQPVRRQIALVDVHAHDLPPGVDLHALPMVVDASGVYFHPEGPYTLVGYSNADEPVGYDFRYGGDEFFEREIWPRLAHRASSFERCRHVRGWAGLYSVTPDCSGLLGRVAGVANALEAHSFTGRGVMQSFAIGRGVAELVVDGRYSALDLSPLAAERFAAGRLLVEDLHI
ncbi:MAG TPA: FAD-binding oxidoreductase [Myxococcota bacterium]|nr:FAD-binding oxidoreductase [Myxococcota bacterium]